MKRHRNTDKSKLRDKLGMAIKWQNQIDITQEENLGIKYDSPHMWIVALIGSDRFLINDTEKEDLCKELKKENIIEIGEELDEEDR